MTEHYGEGLNLPCVWTEDGRAAEGRLYAQDTSVERGVKLPVEAGAPVLGASIEVYQGSGGRDTLVQIKAGIYAYLETGDAVDSGSALSADTDGRVIPSVDGYVAARAYGDAGDAGEWILCLVYPPHYEADPVGGGGNGGGGNGGGGNGGGGNGGGGNGGPA